MPRKIAMIGAGSVVFCKTLMSDIMATPALSDSEFALMDLSEIKIRRMEAFGKRMIEGARLGQQRHHQIGLRVAAPALFDALRLRIP